MTPPSTSTSPRSITGGSSPGIATLARSASHKGPSRCTTERAVVRLEEVQK